MTRLYIIRGLPGSGKSTLAKKLAESIGADHFETDMYFIDPTTGEYKFDRNKLAQAHEWCIRNARDAMYNEVDVIISNTFTQFWELEDYLGCAERLKIPVTIVECTAAYGSIHDVPEETRARMRARWISNKDILGGVEMKTDVTLKRAEEFMEEMAEAV
jgi:predicted kinase